MLRSEVSNGAGTAIPRAGGSRLVGRHWWLVRHIRDTTAKGRHLAARLSRPFRWVFGLYSYIDRVLVCTAREKVAPAGHPRRAFSNCSQSPRSGFQLVRRRRRKGGRGSRVGGIQPSIVHRGFGRPSPPGPRNAKWLVSERLVVAPSSGRHATSCTKTSSEASQSPQKCAMKPLPVTALRHKITHHDADDDQRERCEQLQLKLVHLRCRTAVDSVASRRNEIM